MKFKLATLALLSCYLSPSFSQNLNLVTGQTGIISGTSDPVFALADNTATLTIDQNTVLTDPAASSTTAHASLSPSASASLIN